MRTYKKINSLRDKNPCARLYYPTIEIALCTKDAQTRNEEKSKAE